MYRTLVYDSSPEIYEVISSALETQSIIVFKTKEKELQDEIASKQYDLIFFDMSSTDRKAMGVLENISQKNPFMPIIVTSKTEKAELIVAAMNSGACDFLVHPVSKERISFAFKNAIEKRDQQYEIAYHRRKQDVVYHFSDVVAESPGMKVVLKKLERFARTDSTILITGDTGTGKSFLSGTVHFNSPRKKKPFVKINCANISEDLLESELFGHEKGAFTGADKQRIGRFEQASGGTMFLDEIGEISMSLQTKLLRVLEEKSFERVGGNKTIYADVRVIAATNKDLVQQIQNGKFREDLYYRINVLPVRLPSLKERGQCIVPLANRLLSRCCKSLRREIYGFTPQALASVQLYDWPGNIRQLTNTIERAVILEDDTLIHTENLSLPMRIVSNEVASPAVQKKETVPLAEVTAGESLAGQERELILKVLEESLWVQKNAAKKLGISPRALNYKINKLGITHPHWRRNK